MISVTKASLRFRIIVQFLSALFTRAKIICEFLTQRGNLLPVTHDNYLVSIYINA